VQLPEFKGTVFVLKSQNIDDKRTVTGQLMDELKNFKPMKNNRTSLTILIPEAIVSLVIGAKGRSINRLKEQTGSDIVVNQPCSGMNVRGVKIEGKIGAILRGVQAVMNFIEEQAVGFDDIHKVAQGIDKKEQVSKCRIAIKTESSGYLIGKDGQFTKFLLDQFRVNMSIKPERDNYSLKQDESVCNLQGKLVDIDEALKEVCLRLEDFYNNEVRKEFKEYALKILVPGNLVTKIIGAKGCMIKDI